MPNQTINELNNGLRREGTKMDVEWMDFDEVIEVFGTDEKLTERDFQARTNATVLLQE